MIKKLIIITALFLCTIPLLGQEIKSKDWRIGLSIPLLKVNSDQKELWTGASVAYKGFTLNYYGSLSSNFIVEGSGEFQRKVSQPWVYTSRISVGYSFMLGNETESNFNPIIGLYLLTMQGAEPDIDVGFRYKDLVFLLSPHFESQSNAKWFPTFGKATKREVYLKFKVQYLL
jgi:hypothetical protein